MKLQRLNIIGRASGSEPAGRGKKRRDTRFVKTNQKK